MGNVIKNVKYVHKSRQRYRKSLMFLFQVFVQDGDEIRRPTTIEDQGSVQPGLAEGASNGFDP